MDALAVGCDRSIESATVGCGCATGAFPVMASTFGPEDTAGGCFPCPPIRDGESLGVILAWSDGGFTPGLTGAGLTEVDAAGVGADAPLFIVDDVGATPSSAGSPALADGTDPDTGGGPAAETGAGPEATEGAGGTGSIGPTCWALESLRPNSPAPEWAGLAIPGPDGCVAGAGEMIGGAGVCSI